MPVGFGFSVGDFIVAIKLVGTVIDALRNSSHVGSEYRELINQLLGLETALLQFQCLEFEEHQYQQVISLRQAALQCRNTIDAFWEKVQKYQPWLGNSTGNRRYVKEGWIKIKWAICKKEDIAKFKIDLLGHTQSILLLLAVVQRGSNDTNQLGPHERQESIEYKSQETYLHCLQRINTSLEQGKTIFDAVTALLRLNAGIFQAVLCSLQLLTKSLPRQVERQQPVYLTDALDRECPFHLEFIRCPEALLSVLKVNFQKYGHGSQKIDRKEFVIQDTATQRHISLEGDWDKCFFPGQRADMSMIFRKDIHPDTQDSSHHSACPRCQLRIEGETYGGFVNCIRCGMSIRREVIEGFRQEFPAPNSGSCDDNGLRNPSLSRLRRSLIDTEAQDNELAMFQRVYIIESYFQPGTFVQGRTVENKSQSHWIPTYDSITDNSGLQTVIPLYGTDAERLHSGLYQVAEEIVRYPAFARIAQRLIEEKPSSELSHCIEELFSMQRKQKILLHI